MNAAAEHSHGILESSALANGLAHQQQFDEVTPHDHGVRMDTDLPAKPTTDMDVAETPEFTEEYALPTWAEFRTFVMENGNKYVRASYPDAPADLIETIWCGVPVVPHEQARVMTPKGEWLVY